MPEFINALAPAVRLMQEYLYGVAKIQLNLKICARISSPYPPDLLIAENILLAADHDLLAVDTTGWTGSPSRAAWPTFIATNSLGRRSPVTSTT
jgi:hypothetical protein